MSIMNFLKGTTEPPCAEEVDSVTLDKRVRNTSQQNTQAQKVTYIVGCDRSDGKNVKTNEFDSYFKARQRAEEMCKNLKRPFDDRVAGVTRKWDDLDKPFYQVWLEEGRSTELPATPSGNECRFSQSDGSCRLHLPPESSPSEVLRSSIVIATIFTAIIFIFVHEWAHFEFILAGAFVAMFYMARTSLNRSLLPRELEGRLREAHPPQG